MRKLIRIGLALCALALGGVVAVGQETATAPPAGAQAQLAGQEHFHIVSGNFNYALKFEYWVYADTNYFFVVANRYDRNWNYLGNEIYNYMQDTICPTLEWSSQYGYFIAYRDNYTWERTWTCQINQRTPRQVNHNDAHSGQFHDFWCYFACDYKGAHGYTAYGYWAPMHRGVEGRPIQQLL